MPYFAGVMSSGLPRGHLVRLGADDIHHRCDVTLISTTQRIYIDHLLLTHLRRYKVLRHELGSPSRLPTGNFIFSSSFNVGLRCNTVTTSIQGSAGSTGCIPHQI